MHSITTIAAVASIAALLPQDHGKVMQGTEGAAAPHASLDALMSTDVVLAPSTEARREAAEEGESPDRPKGGIEDFVIDVQSGSLDYAVVSIGGFLGIDSKNVLMETASLAPKSIDKKRCYELSMTEDELSLLPEFDAERAENNLSASLRALDGSFSDEQVDEVEASASGAPRYVLASQLMDCDVQATDETFGDVQDAVVRTAGHEVSHLLVSRGGVAGLGDTVYILPLEAVKIARADKSLRLEVNRKAEALETAVRYEKPKEGFVREADLKRADEIAMK